MNTPNDPKLPLTNPLEPQTWAAFQDAGMLWAMNSILHWFGWCIVVVVDDESHDVVKAYPARTKYRGFPRDSNDRGVKRLTEWLASAGATLQTDIADEPKASEPAPLKRYWVSWYHQEDYSSFRVDTAWWSTGWNDTAETICAAVLATDPENARLQITAAYGSPHELKFRFMTEKPGDWSPFGERFPRADWMQWPE
jgi:hypothetical protein